MCVCVYLCVLQKVIESIDLKEIKGVHGAVWRERQKERNYAIIISENENYY